MNKKIRTYSAFRDLKFPKGLILTCKFRKGDIIEGDIKKGDMIVVNSLKTINIYQVELNFLYNDINIYINEGDLEANEIELSELMDKEIEIMSFSNS